MIEFEEELVFGFKVCKRYSLVNTNDRELTHRLVKATFLFETGINLSIMFCLETLIVASQGVSRDFLSNAIESFREQLSSNEMVEKLIDVVTEEYYSQHEDKAENLDSILSLLDGPLSFEIAFFFTVLDPDFRSIIRARCLELALRYRGSISEKKARDLVGRILEEGEHILFSGKRLTFPYSETKRKEVEADFREYLGRYRASSQEEINDQKIRFNLGAEGISRPSLPVGRKLEAITDWRSFCRYSYLSNRFSIFPELVAEQTVALTIQESLFIPRAIEVRRAKDDRILKTFDGIWYIRERLNKPGAKVLNVHGARGNGLSSFARMLTVNLAMAYSRGTSKVIPIYIDLLGRTSSELVNLTEIIDCEILHSVDDLTYSWSMEPTILIFDNFDRVLFKDSTQRKKYIGSFLDLSRVLRKGGVILTTDKEVTLSKPGIDIENVLLDSFSAVNIRDWMKSWGDILNKEIVKIEGINPDLLELFANPLFLWQAFNYSWADFLRNPLQGRIGLLKSLFQETVHASAQYLLKGDRKIVDEHLLANFLTEVAWKNYSSQAIVGKLSSEELLLNEGISISPDSLIRLRPIRVMDILGNRSSDLGFSLASSTIEDFLIANRFIKALRKKDLLSILGRPLTENILKMVIEILDMEVGYENKEETYKKLRDTCWQWFKFPAVAVVPKKTIAGQLAFSDIEIFSDFRLFCFLVLTELTRTIGDEMPLNKGSATALSLLIKSLQCNEYEGRIDFKKYLSNLNLKGVHFNDIDLAGAEFSNCKLDDAVFSRCNLENADFSDSSLVGSRFNNCQMKNFSAIKADFTGCTVSYCDFSGSKLREANFKASSFINVSFANSLLIGARMSKSSFNSSSFQGANVNGGVFSRADFQSIDFTQAKMVGTRFSECNFSFCMFNKTDMTICSFDDSTISKVLLLDSYAGGISVIKAVFKDLNCSNCVFREGDFNRVDLSECQIIKADFTAADLTGANFSGANISDSDFTRVILTMAKLLDASIKKSLGFEKVISCEGANISGLTGISPRSRIFLKRNGAKETVAPQKRKEQNKLEL